MTLIQKIQYAKFSVKPKVYYLFHNKIESQGGQSKDSITFLIENQDIFQSVAALKQLQLTKGNIYSICESFAFRLLTTKVKLI